MPKTVLQLVAELRERKNKLADEICRRHDLPPMTWDSLGTWAIKHDIKIDLWYLFSENHSGKVHRKVDGNNYARRKDETK